jgi:hypothetical protein
VVLYWFFQELFPAIRLYLFIRKKADEKDTASIRARAFALKSGICGFP